MKNSVSTLTDKTLGKTAESATKATKKTVFKKIKNTINKRQITETGNPNRKYFVYTQSQFFF